MPPSSPNKAEAPRSSHKRQRQRQRPPPPLPPPASLVKLLQRDPTVLQYFRSLQANLEADVQVWKDRARAWQDQVQALEQGGSSKVAAAAAANKRRRRKRQDSDVNDSDDSDDNAQHTTNEFNEDELSYPTSSEEEENENDKDNKSNEGSTRETQQSSVGDEKKRASDKNNLQPTITMDPTTQTYLDQVVHALQELNIAMVDPADATCRTNAQVCQDLRFALQSLCRVATTDVELATTHPPFDVGRSSTNSSSSTDTTFVPAPGTDHPARLGLRLVFRTMVLLEEYGAAWRAQPMFGGDDRSRVVKILERTVSREIQHGWAAEDRAARLGPHAGSNTFVSDDTLAENDNQNSPATDSRSGTTTKSLSKLSFLLERSYWARILIGLYMSRNEKSHALRLIREYVLATVPCCHNEDSVYPQHPPVLSFVVLEAMVRPRLEEMGWGEQETQDFVELYSSLWGETVDAAIVNCYGMCLEYTANIWNERTTSSVSHIRQVAQTEYAAYQRLCNECGLVKVTSIPFDAKGLATLCESIERKLDSDENMIEAYQFCLVFHGKVDIADLVWDPDKTLRWNLTRVECMCRAIRHVYVRGLEAAANTVGSKAALNCPADTLLKECREQFDWLWDLNPFEMDVEKAQVLATLIKCAVLLTDGNSVIRYTTRLVELLKTMTSDKYAWQSLRPVWDALVLACNRPMIRIINLERRQDRWKHMLRQAMAQDYLIIRGLGDLQGTESNGKESLTHGGFAMDGQWPRSRLIESVGSTSQLSKLIQTEWQPLDMVPFDKDTPRNENFVSMNSSEVACALSHIACWKACLRTFDMAPTSAVPHTKMGLIRQPDLVMRDCLLAGYATGPPLRQENSGMYPTPVCLVMEDDAHVVDDFVEALQDLLTQLPRDFHYCALGYGRPKSAPILRPWPDRPRLGVPTHLFFATAYLVSASGLTYLDDHGPVQGPIDVWLGLRQTRNFDNLVGQQLGVGGHGMGGDFTQDQAAVLDFAAYCSVPQLCNQRLGSGNRNGKFRRWQDKDSDIVYSGHTQISRV